MTTSYPEVRDLSDCFIVNLSKDFIGLRTDPGANNLFFVTNGTDDFRYYIKTKRVAEQAILERIRATVITEVDHELENNDIVEINVVSQTVSGIGVNTSVTVVFDDISQSLVVDPRVSQPAGIGTIDNLIRIVDHKFVLGDYILYENYETAIAGLETHRKYFVIHLTLTALSWLRHLRISVLVLRDLLL